MPINRKGSEALKEYRRKLKAGEIEKPQAKNFLERWEELTPEKKKRSYKAACLAKCWECSCGQQAEITHCTIIKCPLWLIRPYQKKDSE